MDKDDIKKRIIEEDDYIRSPKFFNSLTKFLAKHSDGVDNNAIGRLLMLPEEEVESIYQDCIKELREEMSED